MALTDGSPERVREAAMDPDLPIIDPHHHFWREAAPDPFRHPKYMLPELTADLSSGHNIRATVYIQCGTGYRSDGPEHLKPVGETEFVQALADEWEQGGFGDTNICAGIIVYADLALGNAVDEVLAAHKEAAPERFKGIRYGAFWHEDADVHPPMMGTVPGILADENFRTSVDRLAAFDLTYETWIYHTQFDEFAAFAQRCAGTKIILNHLGGPAAGGPYAGKRDEVFAVWKEGMSKLAACANVVVKLGGINMAPTGFDWDERSSAPGSEKIALETRDYYLHAIDCFGPERCMFESNFPVERVAYPTLWNVFKRIVRDFSDGDKASLFYGTAARTYGLTE